ncbi:hypothetical protein [Nitrosomonas aestuarii]|uniref:hypothetical protein n=1 Tax=Nitrosomonas aestuarii TaxID=52441 RepID=UPI000D31156A|nr:hypothetical protein [Nitrosomonas aestuarii]PTN12485.1 hypothetical protein C8R11_10353 [Nitrosomonas aestuarii]
MHDKTINANITKDSAAPLKLEPDAYRHHLDEFDLTQDQQNELLSSLWAIMSTMVDIGWGVDTVQILLPDIYAEVAPDSEKLLESQDAPEFDQAADTHKKGQKNDE